MSDSDEIVKEFLAESGENLDRLDRNLVELEKHPSDREILADIFRTIHTIKGTSGFLGFSKLEAVTHVGESLLARLRDGQLQLNPERTTVLLAMVDAVRQMLDCIAEGGTDGAQEYRDLIERLNSIQASTTAAKDEPLLPPTPQAAKETPAAANLEKFPPLPGRLGDVLVEHGHVTPKQLARALHEQEQGNPQPVGEILVESGALHAQELQDVLKSPHTPPPEDATIRIRVAQLDRLMNLVGELVLARNRIQQWVGLEADSGLLGTSQRLNLITTELQEGVMKTRLQPIGNIWSKFPRTARDVAHSCGKQVRIELEGKETELDKTIIEAIKDPLTHLVRNAVDHGIESPEARQVAGKPAEGRLLLRAFHEGGQVIIEITDDGAGLNLERIRDKAIKKGLVSSDEAARMSERELCNLIFLPGLSTAEKVTNVSGRGVGMDVVRTNIEKIGGLVDVQTAAGQGTTVRLKIPLTLAIVPALIVTSASERYAIPQVSLVELVGIDGGRQQTGIEMIQGAPVYRLRGRLLPVVYLGRELGQTAHSSGSNRAGASGENVLQERGRINIVVLQADDRQFGLVVDSIRDTEEIVVKPLGKQLKSVNVFAGATIMGDGRVALILDVLGLAKRARVVSEGRERSAAEAEGKLAQDEALHARHRPVLLVQCGDKGRVAIDLAAVARVEEFSPERLELSSGQEAVQYRGHIMPLIRLTRVLDDGGASDIAGSCPLQVVVHEQSGRNVGLVVDRILDVVDEPFQLKRQTARSGVLGSAVIQKRITDFLDVSGLIASVLPADSGAEPMA